MQISKVNIYNNQQNPKPQNFRGFKATDNEVLQGMKEITTFFPLKDVLKKGKGAPVANSKGFARIGHFFTEKQISKYLREHPDTYLLPSDIELLIRKPTAYIGGLNGVSNPIQTRLDTRILTKENTPFITLEQLQQILPNVIEKKSTANAAVKAAKLALGI